MAWFDPRLAALLVSLLGPPAGDAIELPAVAEVVAPALDVFDEPDDRAVAAGRLRRGDEVAVREVGRDGWVAIEPPPGSFVWVEQSALRRQSGESEVRVETEGAVVRAGHPGARLPGAPRGTLPRGTSLRLLAMPPLSAGRPAKAWRAVEPPPGQVRYIRAEGVEWRRATAPQAAEPPRETRAAFLGEPPLPRPPAGVAAEINRLEQAHRAILREPIDQWRLEPIRQGYQALLKRVTDSASGNAIRTRLDAVARHAAAAEAARSIEATLDRSRNRDRKLALEMRKIAEVEDPQDRPYDAQGMIQPSSRKVDGQKVFALIGPEGRATAYLSVPAGLDASPYLARRVGVRGTVHYNESLHAKLITVRDLDPLDAVR